MQWMRDHNHLIEVLSGRLKVMFPDLVVHEDTADKMNFTMNDREFYISECELVLDLETHVIAVTFLDNASNLLDLIRHRNNPLDRLIYSQPDNAAEDIWDRLIRGVYVTQDPTINLEMYYDLRKVKTSFIDKMVFRGNYTGVGRGSIDHLMGSKYSDVFDGPHGLNPAQYFHNLIQYKVGLSLPGIGELCYRDLEYMAIGLPMLRFDYEHPLNPPLIPNYHYISIPRPENFPWLVERTGSAEIAQMYVDRFNEVKDDTAFLAQISTNAKQYYEEFFSPRVRVQRVLSLMGLSNG
jgi:hypothetical protein